MNRAAVAPALALAALLLAGPAPAGEANPPLERITVVVGGRVEVSSEVARTDRQRALGLSNRAFLGEGEGMLLLFGGVGPASIWMKEMRFSLDIFWINGGRIVMIKDRVRPMGADCPPEVFTAEAEAVLEVPAGFAAAKGIVVGDTVRFREAGRAGPGGNR